MEPFEQAEEQEKECEQDDMEVISETLVQIMNHLTEIHRVISATELSEKADRIITMFSSIEFTINTSYRRFLQVLEENQHRFANMVNEYKGLVAIERGKREAINKEIKALLKGFVE